MTSNSGSTNLRRMLTRSSGSFGTRSTTSVSRRNTLQSALALDPARSGSGNVGTGRPASCRSSAFSIRLGSTSRSHHQWTVARGPVDSFGKSMERRISVWEGKPRPSEIINDVLSGKIAFKDVPPAIQSACGQEIYNGAVAILNLPKEVRKAALQRVPRSVRGQVEREVWRIWSIRNDV